VQSLSIKSTKSASLPIWSCKLGTEEGARWRGLQPEDGVGGDDGDLETMDVETPYAAKAAKSTSKTTLHSGKRACGSLLSPFAN
jgi:hypothetical protein